MKKEHIAAALWTLAIFLLMTLIGVVLYYYPTYMIVAIGIIGIILFIIAIYFIISTIIEII